MSGSLALLTLSRCLLEGASATLAWSGCFLRSGPIARLCAGPPGAPRRSPDESWPSPATYLRGPVRPREKLTYQASGFLGDDVQAEYLGVTGSVD
jgi:hypothetical protein